MSMTICDAHTHFFSHIFFSTLLGQAGAAPEHLEKLRDEAGIELPSQDTAAHTQRWIAELDRYDIRAAVSFASVPPEGPTVLEASKLGGDRLIPYLTCDPTRPEGVEATVKGLRQGARGVLLFPAMQRFDPSSTLLDPIYEEARSHRAPVVVHCGVLQIKLRDLLGVRPQYDLRFATPLAVSAAAERHRDVIFVLPHFGGGFFAEALLAGAQSRNVWVDTSSSNSWMATQPQPLCLDEVFARSLAVFGPERILFGTDSSTFPRGWRHDVFEEQAAALERLDVEGAAKRRLLGENLAELLEL
jgi:predicted TIM-barrel fold metal-dependent hydrolase